MIDYNEEHLLVQIEELSQVQKTTFAAACAERLQPLYARFISEKGEPPVSLAGILDKIWASIAGDINDIASEALKAESLVPDEDDSWELVTGYAQNAAAATAYAGRTWIENGAQEAVWAARQVYEAADLASQHSTEDSSMDANLSSRIVQLALAGIQDDLASVTSQSMPWAEVRERARQQSTGWAQLLL